MVKYNLVQQCNGVLWDNEKSVDDSHDYNM